VAGNDLLFSKHVERRFPEDQEIIDQLERRNG
jgi:hypothetical protein